MRRWFNAWVLFLAAPAFAQDSPMIGTWCTQDGGEIMYVQADGIGFNEHTICDVETPPGIGAYATQLTCRNVYVVDGETVEAFAETMAFRAEMTSSDTLTVTLRNETETAAFGRCE